MSDKSSEDSSSSSSSSSSEESDSDFSDTVNSDRDQTSSSSDSEEDRWAKYSRKYSLAISFITCLKFRFIQRNWERRIILSALA